MIHDTKFERSSAWRRATRHWAFRVSVPLGALAVLGLLGLSVMPATTTLVAQGDPQPVCVACPAGYHCVHNPEGCEKD